MKKERPKKTELNHKLLWYVEHYKLSLNTVRRHRELLDHPLLLLAEVLNSTGREANAQGLLDYLNKHPDEDHY